MSEVRQSRALRPDAQAFDEVRIVTVPRYKMSGMSGDEWRISATIQLMRKGKVIHEQGFRNVETAARFLDHVVMRAMDDGLAYYAGEGDVCDQEGCSDIATVTYKLKDRFCSRCGEGRSASASFLGESIQVRRFCQRHSRRGDCGLDDADRNYELIEGAVGMPQDSDMSESGQIIFEVQNVDEIQLALKKALGNEEQP